MLRRIGPASSRPLSQHSARRERDIPTLATAEEVVAISGLGLEHHGGMSGGGSSNDGGAALHHRSYRPC
ncbi:MAG TPA: hypothetical protein VGO47_05880 [Chlamydiales bacterium]|nr:hypothetical protein [Chlamydiales bacterium]